jgi:large subunit ribosomal protein L24
MKLKLKKGDLVKVIAGDDKGREGRIITMLPKEQKAIVEGLNMVTKHVKPNANNTKGGIEKREAPIHLSKLMLVYGNQTTRVGRKLVDGKLVRFAKKSGEVIK